MLAEEVLIKLKYAFVAFVVLLVFGAIFATPFYVYLTGGSEEITVQNKERVCNRTENGNNCRYLIWTEENGVYQNTDTLLRLKFNSSNVYGKFKTGETYKIDYYGWRIPFLSWYPNIYNVKNL